MVEQSKKWNLKDWFVGKWSTIKEILKFGIPLIIGWSTTHSPEWTALITIGGNFVLDVGHFFYNKWRNKK